MASFASELSADVCVAGSGIAGLLFAERLVERSRGRRVLVIERGTAMTHQQRLARGSHDDPLPFNRARFDLPHEAPPVGPRTRWDRSYAYRPVYNLGGCTNHFFGNMPRFHPTHFEQDAFGGAVRLWPIGYAELEPYYLQAEQRLQVAGSSEQVPFAGRFDYPLPPHRLSPADRACAELLGPGSVVPVPTTRISRRVDGRDPCCGTNRCDLCPIDAKGSALNTVYPNVRERLDLKTGLLITELRCRGGRVRSAVAVDESGGQHLIHASRFVVACNGVDSCLLLQRSPTVPQLPALGRYFMDHPSFDIALYDGRVDARPGYGDSAQTGMLLSFFEQMDRDLPVSVLGEVRPAIFSLNAGQALRDVLLNDVLNRSLETFDGGSFRDRFQQVWNGSIDLLFLVEPQPMPDHTLAIDRIDPNGQAIPRLQLGYPSYLSSCVERVLGRLRAAAPSAVVRHLATFPTSFHWLGATRMSTRDDVGCVDSTLRYHGLENLFVLSSSVFPSASSANPTLTLATLALRLGDHLGGPASQG